MKTLNEYNGMKPGDKILTRDYGYYCLDLIEDRTDDEEAKGSPLFHCHLIADSKGNKKDNQRKQTFDASWCLKVEDNDPNITEQFINERVWKLTGITDANKEVCFICEKLLLKVSEDAICQSWGGGQVTVSMNFGSRYDWLGARNPIGDGKGWLGVEGSEPSPTVLQHPNRCARLSACNRIIATICDECFEEKAKFFKGYEKKNDKFELLVD